MSIEFRSGYLPVAIDHQIYFEDVGNPALAALFFVHGGPGIGCEEKHREQFDLKKYRVVLFDQRGSGRSQTQGEINDNTTELLVKDIETLRKRLKIDKFCILGSSWGAVLATQYTALFPERITKMILKSPFLARKKDFDWAYTFTGVAKLLPEDWKIFSMNESLQGKALVEKYHAEVVEKENVEMLCRWLNWEGAQYFYSRPAERVDFTPSTLNPYWKNVARIQIHYTKNNFFMGDEGILPSIKKIVATNIPGLCLQGEKDIITPPAESETLAKLWPSLEYRSIAGADHKIPANELFKL